MFFYSPRPSPPPSRQPQQQQQQTRESQQVPSLHYGTSLSPSTAAAQIHRSASTVSGAGLHRARPPPFHQRVITRNGTSIADAVLIPTHAAATTSAVSALLSAGTIVAATANASLVPEEPRVECAATPRKVGRQASMMHANGRRRGYRRVRSQSIGACASHHENLAFVDDDSFDAYRAKRDVTIVMTATAASSETAVSVAPVSFFGAAAGTTRRRTSGGGSGGAAVQKYFAAPPLSTSAICSGVAGGGGSSGSGAIAATLQQQHGGGRTTTVILRRPTITVQEDGRIVINHVAARWDGSATAGLLDGIGGASGGDGDDGTILSGSLKEEFGGLRAKANRLIDRSVKYFKILLPHVVLVSVLIGYLCLGAYVLSILEMRTELMARSRKLIRVSNLMTAFTNESWWLVSDAQTGSRLLRQDEWSQVFREYMVRLAETIDERRPIRRELETPHLLENMHNKWTFPTALLYVLTVLTTCGYGEVSVDTDTGKIFSVIFALVGIPLMFITAADIGKFLSETLLRFVKNWHAFVDYVKAFFRQRLFRKHKKYDRRKSSVVAPGAGQFETLGLLGNGLLDDAEENLWFPIGAYVSCICLYCSMGSAMFINWERNWSFIHAFHFGFNLIVTVGLGDIVVTDYLFLSLIVAFVIVGLSVVTMCVDLASTHLKAYFTRIHYFGRARRILGISEELREIVSLLGAMRRKKNGKVTWNDVRDFLGNELCDRPFEPHDLLMKLRFIDETSSVMSTIRHNSLQSELFRDAEYLRRLAALRPTITAADAAADENHNVTAVMTPTAQRPNANNHQHYHQRYGPAYL